MNIPVGFSVRGPTRAHQTPATLCQSGNDDGWLPLQHNSTRGEGAAWPILFG